MTSLTTFFTKETNYFWQFNKLRKRGGRRELRERIVSRYEFWVIMK